MRWIIQIISNSLFIFGYLPFVFVCALFWKHTLINFLFRFVNQKSNTGKPFSVKKFQISACFAAFQHRNVHEIVTHIFTDIFYLPLYNKKVDNLLFLTILDKPPSLNCPSQCIYRKMSTCLRISNLTCLCASFNHSTLNLPMPFVNRMGWKDISHSFVHAHYPSRSFAILKKVDNLL